MPDVAQSENVSTAVQSAVFMAVTALFVALALKTTGLLLVSALLIIPPATARFLRKRPKKWLPEDLSSACSALSPGWPVQFILIRPPPRRWKSSALFYFCCVVCYTAVIK